MAIPQAKQADRLDLRADTAIKARWQHAADLLGVPVAAFVKMAATERADQIIHSQELLALSAEDSRWFTDFLMQPPREPAAELQRAATMSRELLGE